MKVGKAKYSGGKKVFKVKDGDNVYRILPPLGKLADAGKWSMYYRVEWGYKDSEGRNRPFLDCRKVNFQTKMVEVESAAHLRREALKKQKDEIVAAFKAGNATKEQVQEATDLVKQYNQDAKHYLNVISINGEIGLLKIGHKAKLALDTEITKLREKGIDPLSLENGRFFNFHRSNPTGNFRDTNYQVTVYRENVQIDGKTYEQEKVHVIDDSIISRLSEEAFELADMYPAPTAEEVERLVVEGASAVDELLVGKNEQGNSGSSQGGSAPAASGNSAPSAPSSTPNMAAGSTASAAPSAPVQQEAPAPKAEAAPAPEATTQPAQQEAKEEPSKEQSNEEFLRNLGVL